MRVSADSNILVYSVDPNDRGKQAIAIELIRRLAVHQNVLIEQCLFEFLHVTTRKLGSPLGLALATVASWTNSFGIALASPNTLSLAISLLARLKISVWNARLLAICDAYGIEILLTEDLQDGGKYDKVTAINPFNVANSGFIDRILPP